MTSALDAALRYTQERAAERRGTPGPCSPPIKWVGGKGGLLAQLLPLLPSDAGERRHAELFAGGAAMFYARAPEAALLADTNHALIAMHTAVRDYTESVIFELSELERRHRADARATYYDARDRFNAMRAASWSEIDIAAHFIYLNKTCFNGLYRVNRKGAFNVPMGAYKNPKICDPDGIRKASVVLARATLTTLPFERAAESCSSGDFVYLDPPYEPVSRTASFVGYDAAGFTQDDQVRLRGVFRWLDDRGCKVMLSNSDVPFIRELYRDFKIDTVQARRAVNRDAAKRGPVSEVVVRNYE